MVEYKRIHRFIVKTRPYSRRSHVHVVKEVNGTFIDVTEEFDKPHKEVKNKKHKRDITAEALEFDSAPSKARYEPKDTQKKDFMKSRNQRNKPVYKDEPTEILHLPPRPKIFTPIPPASDTSECDDSDSEDIDDYEHRADSDEEFFERCKRSAERVWDIRDEELKNIRTEGGKYPDFGEFLLELMEEDPHKELNDCFYDLNDDLCGNKFEDLD